MTRERLSELEEIARGAANLSIEKAPRSRCEVFSTFAVFYFSGPASSPGHLATVSVDADGNATVQ